MDEDPREPLPPHLQVSLCARCRDGRVIRSARGSVFMNCGRAASDPSYTKYPVQPVVACTGFEE
ncbi:MAG: hypothetical protein ACYSWX_15570 [Planctomycetota bacterium]|jgi:hypothetical protein